MFRPFSAISREVFNKEKHNIASGVFDNAVLFFVEHLPEDGRKRPKHVEGLLCDRVPFYLIAVQLLE
jgi:hypothetical protein